MKDKVLIGIIVVLTLVFIFEGVYLFSHWNKNNENGDLEVPNENNNAVDENPSEEENYVKIVNTREDAHQVVQEYEMVLNGEHKNFDVSFDIDEQEGYFEINATIGNENVFRIMNDFEEAPDNYISYINEYFNEDNFIIFSGADDVDYLIVETFFLPPANGIGMDYNFYNQNFEFIGALDVIVQGQSLQVEDESIFYNKERYEDYQIRSRIDNDKIYNLYQKDCLDDYIEERVYTINNNRLEYEVINTYQVFEVAGAC